VVVAVVEKELDAVEEDGEENEEEGYPRLHFRLL
jgi:hypothetical protein